jgi:hypothetical protein
MSPPTLKVFIRYNRADCEWADWIAGVLERATDQPIVLTWDFRPGENFGVRTMEAAEEVDLNRQGLRPGNPKGRELTVTAGRHPRSGVPVLARLEIHHAKEVP